jgi:hypothetical protein
LAVLAHLGDGGLRYQDLDDGLDGISHKVLTERCDEPNATGCSYATSILAALRRRPSISSPS